MGRVLCRLWLFVLLFDWVCKAIGEVAHIPWVTDSCGGQVGGTDYECASPGFSCALAHTPQLTARRVSVAMS